MYKLFSLRVSLFFAVFITACGGGSSSSGSSSRGSLDPDAITGDNTASSEAVIYDSSSIDAPVNPNVSDLNAVTLSVRNAKLLTDTSQDRRQNYSASAEQPVQFESRADGEDYASWILSNSDGVEYTAPIDATHFSLSYATANISAEFTVSVNSVETAVLPLERNLEDDWYNELPGAASQIDFVIEAGVSPGDKIQIYPVSAEAANIGALTFFRSVDDVVEVPPVADPGELTISSFLTSTHTGARYPVNIYLPYDYYYSDASYPVIYVLDGQFHDGYFSNVVSAFGLPAIVVGIEDAGRRLIDYLAPGIYTYENFLTQELIPFIENNYRASPLNRTITGVSASGIASGFLYLIDDPNTPTFDHYFSFDAPFFSANSAELNRVIDQRRAMSADVDGNLVLIGALLPGDIPPFDASVRRFRDDIENTFSSYNIYYNSYSVNHFDVTRFAWSDYVDLIFQTSN